MTTTAVGKQLSERNPDKAEVDRWADAMTEMLMAYLSRLGSRLGAHGRVGAPADASRHGATAVAVSDRTPMRRTRSFR